MASLLKPFDANDPAFGDLAARSAAALLAVGGDIALVMDSSGVIRDVAVTGTEAHFADSRLWVGRPWIDTVTGETRLKIEALLKEAAASGVSKRRQVNHVFTDGVDVPISYTTLRLGHVGEIVAVGRDMRHVSAL